MRTACSMPSPSNLQCPPSSSVSTTKHRHKTCAQLSWLYLEMAGHGERCLGGKHVRFEGSPVMATNGLMGWVWAITDISSVQSSRKGSLNRKISLHKFFSHWSVVPLHPWVLLSPLPCAHLWLRAGTSKQVKGTGPCKSSYGI